MAAAGVRRARSRGLALCPLSPATCLHWRRSNSHYPALILQATVDKYGRLDIAFNNAGIASNPIPLPDVPLEDWRRVIATDLDSVFYACKTQAPAMKASGGGAIINTASIAGLSAGPNLAPYAAAKHGVVGLTRAAANDLASWGIRVNALCPGVVVTPILGPFSKTKMFEDMAANALQKRFAPPEDLVPQVMLLASNEASAYTTGTTIVIDGGQTSHF